MVKQNRRSFKITQGNEMWSILSPFLPSFTSRASSVAVNISSSAVEGTEKCEKLLLRHTRAGAWITFFTSLRSTIVVLEECSKSGY